MLWIAGYLLVGLAYWWATEPDFVARSRERKIFLHALYVIYWFPLFIDNLIKHVRHRRR